MKKMMIERIENKSGGLIMIVGPLKNDRSPSLNTLQLVVKSVANFVWGPNMKFGHNDSH